MIRRETVTLAGREFPIDDLDGILSFWEKLPEEFWEDGKIQDEIDVAFRAVAQDMYHENGRIEIDDTAVVSIDEEHLGKAEGAYVAAWVWVPRL